MLLYLFILIGVLERGFIGSLVVMAIILTSRWMKFDDFSLEGTFGLGGALGAFLLLHGISPWIALVCGALAGGICGIGTGLLHTALGLNRLVSGIVTTTMLFSLSLNLGGANQDLSNTPSIFSFVNALNGGTLLLLGSTSLFIACFLIWYSKTESGYLLRSTGLNAQFVVSLGKSPSFYLILSLFIGNFLSAFSGGLFIQYSQFYSAYGNVGILLSALAGCMIGELFAWNAFLCAILGSVIYQGILSLTLQFQIETSWQKFLTGLLIVTLLLIKKVNPHSKERSHAQA